MPWHARLTRSARRHSLLALAVHSVLIRCTWCFGHVQVLTTGLAHGIATWLSRRLHRLRRPILCCDQAGAALDREEPTVGPLLVTDGHQGEGCRSRSDRWPEPPPVIWSLTDPHWASQQPIGEACMWFAERVEPETQCSVALFSRCRCSLCHDQLYLVFQACSRCAAPGQLLADSHPIKQSVIEPLWAGYSL